MCQTGNKIRAFAGILLVLLLFVIAIPKSAFSQQREHLPAKQMATDFMQSRKQYLHGTVLKYSDADVKQVYQSSAGTSKPVYVFQNQDQGFVIISQQRDGLNIVGYSDEGVFESDNLPPQLVGLLKYYEDSLIVSKLDINTLKQATPLVAPLLDAYGIRLNQFNHAQVGNCPTGCVATAVTQIMLYHAARLGTTIKGSGSYCYTDGKYGEICADFEGIEYNSDELLSFHVGNSMEMQYCGSPYGSVPNKDFAPGLEEHFSYYTLSSIEDDFYIINELKNHRPLNAGLFGDPVGHAVVIDGYDDRGYYHVNFGWDGHYNGYYWLNSNKTFSPGGFYQFSTNISDIRMVVPYIIPVVEQDSLALLALHQAMGGFAATGWDVSQPVMKWPGIIIMNGRVIELTLSAGANPAAVQSIAPEIGNLTALRKLYLSGPLNGDIPASLAQLTELRELYLHNTPLYDSGTQTLHTGNISGQLPSNIGNLINLELLSFSNALHGTLPASVGNLNNLKMLHIYQDTTYFDHGELQGQIPSEIGNLTQLQQLYIINQQVSGTFPSSLASLTQLTELDLSGNQLSGTIPVLNFPKLQYLKLNNNLFSSVEEGAASCLVLKDLEWQDNLIEGELPPYFAQFSDLKFLNLSGNKIASLTDEFATMNNLESIKLDNNALTALPDGIALLNRLKNLSAANNQIGYLPSNLGQSRNLLRLNLPGNQITVIPEELGNSPLLAEIILNDNKITSIPESFGNLVDGVNVFLHNNELQGAIPEPLIRASEENNKFITLGGNRFVYSDLPDSDNIGFDVRHQKEVALTKKVFKVQIGDTVNIDIRSISNLSHSGNIYYWLAYPQLIEVMHDGDRFKGVDNDPVLKLVINEKNINNRYYCKVFNPDVPNFHFDYLGSTVEGVCMEYLNSDTISFQLATDEEILAEEYQDEFVTSLASLPVNSISDGTVTLVPPLKVKRGEVYWEASTDGETWLRISDVMDNGDLKANVKSVSSNELILHPKNDAWYRCVIAETDCAPLRSEALKVDAPGAVLFDEIINVTEELMTIAVDSIEVIVPQFFHNEDFRLTITKLDNPPPAPEGVIAGSAYDVTVSFADKFVMPLIIKLKNLNKVLITETDIDKFKAVYFDDLDRNWIPFESSQLSLQDSTLTFLTDHLTKLSIWFDPDAKWGYTDVYERNNIKVYYKEDEVPFMKFGYDKKQSPQPWHIAGHPEMVQDVTEYLPKIMSEYQRLNLQVPSGKFSVYIKMMDDAGVVGLQGMMFGYILIDAKILTKVELMSVLAHEYMHYTQDYYISAHAGNSFWMEAHATLSDRIVWDETDIPQAESETTLLSGRTGKNYTFQYLANSWDASDRSLLTNNMLGQLNHQYLAGTFLHYLRSYRPEDSKLEPAALLRETPWLGGWRLYLGNFVSTHLNTILGDEYEEYVKYILTGANEKFTLINTEGNPFAFIQDPKNKNVYTHPISYLIKPGGDPVQTDEINISVPYMASKVVLLENQNVDTMLLVNYKREHEFSYDDLVYYVTWNQQKKSMEFLDISDSTEFNFILEARTRDNAEKDFKNYGFLLLINKRYIGVSSLIKNFDASFTLTAMPLLNVEKIAMLNIYNGESPITHTFQDAVSADNTTSDYIMFGNPIAGYLQVSSGIPTYEIKGNTTRKVSNGNTYEVSNTYTLVMDQGIITGKPTMKDSTVYVQKFEHDIITGNLKITEQETKYHYLNTFVEYFEVSPGHFDERQVYSTYLSTVDRKTKTYWLNDVFSYMKPPEQLTGYETAYGDHLIMFETANTTQTQQVVNEIDAHYITSHFDRNGNLTSTEEWNYDNTNFSPAGLRLLFILKILEE